VDVGLVLLVRSRCDTGIVGLIREEASAIWRWEERHQRLVGRLGVVLLATLVLDALGTLAVYHTERHARGTEITSLGDAIFFTTVQLLTVSSQIRNPLTPWGRVVDVALEVWAVIVVAGSAGAIAAFFSDS
jgi:voltage-gated potassium channel